MIEDYVETKVIMAPSGELLLALPIYADQSQVLLNEQQVESITGVKRVSFGVYEKFGYLLYSPQTKVSFYLQSIDLFEDLGVL